MSTDEEWPDQWRRRTLSDPKSSRIAIHHRHGNCIAPLLCHYPWIVYIVYSLWRKMIYMIPFGYQGPDSELPSLIDRASTATPHHLAVAQMIPRGVADFYGSTVPATGQILRDSPLFCRFYCYTSMFDGKDGIAYIMRGLKLDGLDMAQIVQERVVKDPDVCNLYASILIYQLEHASSTFEAKRNIIHTFGQMATWGFGEALVNGCGDMRHIVDHMKAENLPLENLAQCVDFFVRFTKVKPYFEVAVYTDFGVLPELAKLLNHYDEDIVRQATLSLSYISDGDTRVLDVATPELIQRAAALVAHKSEEVMVAGLRLLANFCSVDDDDIAALVVLETGWHTQVPKLLQCASTQVRKETCWMLSNIAAGSKSQTNWLVNSGYMPLCIPALSQELTVQREALWVFKNVADAASKAQMRHLMEDCRYLQPFVAVLDTRDKRAVLPVLDSLDRLLEQSARWQREEEEEEEKEYQKEDAGEEEEKEEEEERKQEGSAYPFVSLLISYGLTTKLAQVKMNLAASPQLEAKTAKLEEHLMKFEEWVEARK